MIEIVKAEKNHLQVIREIAHKTWPTTFGKILSKEQIDYMLEWMYSIDSLTEQTAVKQHRFYLAKEHKEYLGFISLETNYKGYQQTKVHKIYVLPSAQGKGVGKALIDKAISKAKKSDNHSLLLNVNRENPAVNFYLKSGFTLIGKEDIDIGNGFLMEDFVMEKSWSQE